MDLIGLLVFFIILAIATPTMIGMQQRSLMELRSSVAAEQLNAIVKAANNYIQSNYYSIESAGGSAQVSVEQLQSDGFLSQAVSASTPYGGTWNIQIQSPKPGYLDGLITANGGLSLNQAELGTIIAQTHGVGGEVPPLNFEIGGNRNTGTVAYGAYGGWTLNLAGYQNPGPGHIVGLLDYYNGEALNNNYLYRDAIPNHPELNTMQTNIDMGNNSINNVNTIQTGLPTAARQCTQLDSEGHCVGQIMAAGTSELNMPNNWLGGIITRDLYSQDGTIAVGPGQQNANGVEIEQAGMGDSAAGKNQPATGGTIWAISPNDMYRTSIYADNNETSISTEMDNTLLAVATSGANLATNTQNSTISTYNTDGADTYIYANNDGNPQDTGLTTDGNINLGHDQNGACSSNSRIYLAGSQIYDGCDGNLHADPGGGTAYAVQTDGSFLPGDIASSGNYCPVNGDIASDVDGSGHSLNCVNNEWTIMSQSSMAESSNSWCVNVPKYGLWLATGAVHYQNGNNYWSASIYINGQYASSEQGEDDDATIIGSVTTWGGPGPICMMTSTAGGPGYYPLFINAID